ncbi:MAG: discoidin domain-containing protein [Actinomycetota bacterium]|nr:discoidin domain-containing protein [Actinomycetota bacterium]
MGDVYGGGNPTDGNATTYWESAANAFPATATVDFGTAVPSLATVTLRLPPSTAWAARSETLSILTSTDGSSWTTVTASAGHRFDPATGNVVSIPIAATTARYIRVSITGNTGWGAGQLSELEVYQG